MVSPFYGVCSSCRKQVLYDHDGNLPAECPHCGDREGEWL